jgi:O-acetyl-ADP-ribose deacetylase (regulator of RNase III)
MKYLDGNLLDLAEQGKYDLIVHGANCHNTFGAGIAFQIKNRYPKAYLADQMTQAGDKDKLGKFTQAHVSGFKSKPNPDKTIKGLHNKAYNFTVINAYTQYGFLPRNVVNVDYDAIENVFKQIKLLYDMNPQAPCRIGIPMIGAGLAGGEWDLIEEIIDNIGFSDLTCVLYKP